MAAARIQLVHVLDAADLHAVPTCRRARLLTNSGPAATFSELEEGSSKNVRSLVGTAAHRVASTQSVSTLRSTLCKHRGGHCATVCYAW